MRQDVRTDLTQLVDLASLLVWSGGDNKCGIRQHTEEQQSVLDEAEECTAVFDLARHIAGAGEWLDEENTDSGVDAHADAMDLPLIAANIAMGTSEPVRRVLGEIIARESLISMWGDHTTTDPVQVFDAWAEAVRPPAIRLAAAFRHRYNTFAKPWSL